MKRALASVVVLSAVGLAPAVEAGVKKEERTVVTLGGALGGLLNKLGGKSSKEGVVQAVTVVGDRRLTLGEDRGEIVDLGEEKIYELDARKKTYTVTTFADLKKRIEEQRAKAEKESADARKKEEKHASASEAPPATEMDVDVEMNETGQKRTIAGHEARQVTTKAWVHEKGKQIQQSGGMLVTLDTWFGPKIDELDEVQAFDRRYATKMAEVMGFTAPSAAASAGQMASVAATYPGLMLAMKKIEAESKKVDRTGTPLATGLKVTLWKSPAQVTEAEKQSDGMSSGLSGLLAKKLMKKGDPSDPRTDVLSSSSETLAITPGAGAADVAIPAGYSQR